VICTGYILDRFDYKENDLIVTLLLRNHGINTFIVPGGKKKEGFLQFLDCIEFLVLDVEFSRKDEGESRRSLSRITQLNTIKLNSHNIKNTFSFYTSKYLIEIIRVLTLPGMASDRLFHHFGRYPVENKSDFVRMLIWLMKYFGIYPDVKTCSECGTEENLNWGISNELYFLCNGCRQNYPGDKVKLGTDFFKILLFLESNTISNLVINDRQFGSIVSFFSGFLKYTNNIDRELLLEYCI